MMILFQVNVEHLMFGDCEITDFSEFFYNEGPYFAYKICRKSSKKGLCKNKGGKRAPRCIEIR